MNPKSLRSSARRIATLAWPVFVGQLALMAFSTIDTLLMARHGSVGLAALSVGAAVYIVTFIGLMGVVLAIGPIVGRLFGAGQLAAAGAQVHQALWIALALAVLGSTLLAFPAPFLAIAQAPPEVAMQMRGYLFALAVSLPGSLLFTVYRGFNNAVSRPKAVMTLQLSALAVKAPLSAALAFGVPAIGLPSLGVTGCGIATAVAMWSQALIAFVVLRRDPFYARFALFGRGLDRPDPAALGALLKLGLPMGGAIVVEVAAFAFMAIFIARLGTLPVASHQIAANLVTLLFMLPLALSSATTTLAAQHIGAGDLPDARRIGWHGMALAALLALVAGSTVYLARGPIVRLYTPDPAIAAIVLPLLAWVAVFHLGDALQALAGFMLRAWHVAGVTMLVYGASVGGIGLAGGYALAFDVFGITPPALRGVAGFWIASTTGLWLAALALTAVLWWVSRRAEDSAEPKVIPAGSA